MILYSNLSDCDIFEAKGKQSIYPGFFELFHFLLLRKLRHLLPLKTLLDFLPKAFDSSIEKQQIVVSLLAELSSVLNSRFFIEMVNNNDLPFFVFIVVELWNVLIPFDMCSWEVQGLLDMILFVLVRLSKVYQQKISLEAHWQLLSFDSHGGEVGSLAACVFFGFVPFVDGLDFLLLVYQFPKSGRFDASEEFALLLGSLLVASIRIDFTHEFNVFDCGAGFSCKFGLHVVVFIGLLDLYVEDGGFTGLVTDRSFLHLNYNQTDSSLINEFSERQCLQLLFWPQAFKFTSSIIFYMKGLMFVYISLSLNKGQISQFFNRIPFLRLRYINQSFL